MNDYDYGLANSGRPKALGWAQGPQESRLSLDLYSPYGLYKSAFGVSNPLQKLGWYESQAEVKREAMARVVMVGPVGVGKRRLLATLRGWPVEREGKRQSVEDWGFWTVIDLPIEAQEGEW